MRIVERHVQKVASGKRDTYVEWEKGWHRIEDKLGGFPTKRRYTMWAGPTDHEGAFVWEREWESFATMEEAYEKLLATPEAKEIQGSDTLLTSHSVEILFPVTDF